MAHADFLMPPLADLCTIQAGMSVRGKLETGPDGDATVVLLRDTGEGRVVPDKLERASFGDLDARYRVTQGDILFRTRFEPNIAIHLADFPGDAVVIAPLLALRVTATAVDPAYLAWYINQPPAQAHIARGARGTNLRMIPRKVLDELPVALPDIDTQRQIVAIAALSEREGKLLSSIARKRQELTRCELLALAHGTARPKNVEATKKKRIAR